MIEVALNGIKKYYGAVKVLDNVTFEVHTGEKVGIVGRNGTGKTTILKILSGIEGYDGGIFSIRKGTELGYLDQIPVYPENYTAMEVLKTAFEGLYKISNEMNTLEVSMSQLSEYKLDDVMKRYGELQHTFELEGGYEINEKISKVCTGFKLNEALLNQPFSTLSGGEKTTVILGKILLQSPDLLLLDEPSNHLDMESIEWLEEYLREYKGTIIIVSHDRYFLDRVATKIVEVEDMKTETYIGNYSAYVETKEKNLLLQFEAYKDQQKKIQAMEKTIKDLREWGSRGDNKKFFRRAQSMEKMLERIQKIEKPNLEADNIKMGFIDGDRSGNEVIKIKDLSKSFEDKILFHNVNLLVNYKERTALIGKNGCGKSTLIKLLLKEYEADSGAIEFGSNVKFGYLPQNITFTNEEYTILETFRDDIALTEGKAREYLAKFMFYGESVFKKVKNLSGGEKSRLKLAMLMYHKVNLLLLDEPTNHLDIDSIETLEDNLRGFKGTIFFISHDRYFINTIANRIVKIKNKTFLSYGGNYDYYKEIKEKENQQALKVKKQSVDTKEKPKTQKPKVVNVEKSIITLEEKIQKIEHEIKDIEITMEEFLSDYTKLNELCQRKDCLQKEFDTLIEQWIIAIGDNAMILPQEFDIYSN